MQKGLFITFEGLDGSGKSTQIDLLFDSLKERGHKVIRTVEPGGTELGTEIRRLLLHSDLSGMGPETETLLFLASRAELCRKVIRPALEEGDIVISDRFSDSTIVYQGIARGLGQDKIIELNRWATGGLEPDITFILDIDPAECEQRKSKSSKEKDRIESEKMEFKQRLQEGYCRLAGIFEERIVMINGKLDQKSIADKVLKKVLEELG